MARKSVGTVRFEFYPNEVFAFKVDNYRDHGRIWLQSRKSKQQWVCEVEDVGQHAEDGILLPRNVLLNFVTAAFKIKGPALPSRVIDLIRLESGRNLHLIVQLAVGIPGCSQGSSYWEFLFPMVPVVHELESRVRELEERLEGL